MNSVKQIFTGIAGVALLSTSLGSFEMLDETERGIDYRFGKMVTTNASELRPQGLTFKMPFVTTVKSVDISLQQADYRNLSTYTKDNQVITVSLTVMYKLPLDGLVDIYKNNPEFLSKMERTVQDAAKTALGQEEAQNVAQNRDEIMKAVTLETATQVRKLLGIEVVAVKMPNFDFDDAFDKAVGKAANAKAVLNEKQTELAQQKVEKAKTIVRAEAAKDSAILKADAQAYTSLANKKAQAEGNLALAKSKAEGNLAIAKAEAEGFKKIVFSIGKENIATYLQTNKWNGDVPKVSGPAATIVDMGSIAKISSPRR